MEQPVKACLRTPLRELSGHNGVVISADWLNSGDQVITASWDRTAILFDAETGECVNVLSGNYSRLWILGFCPTQSCYILLVSMNSNVFLHNYEFYTLKLTLRIYPVYLPPGRCILLKFFMEYINTVTLCLV